MRHSLVDICLALRVQLVLGDDWPGIQVPRDVGLAEKVVRNVVAFFMLEDDACTRLETEERQKRMSPDFIHHVFGGNGTRKETEKR